MERNFRFLREEFIYSQHFGRLTLKTSYAPPTDLAQHIYKLISERKHSKLKRITARASYPKRNLFIKISTLDSWKSIARTTLGMQRPLKHGGGYDWPLEELLNSLHANRLKIPSPPVLGYGYLRNPLGCISEIFLITEDLSPHVNGKDWLAIHGNNPAPFLKNAINLILQLQKENFSPLDPWVANFMISPNDPNDIRIIDLENCLTTPTHHPQETLGMQLGILFQQETFKYISEDDFDSPILSAINTEGIHCDERFWQTYTTAKKERISRKSRRKAALTGLILTN